MKMFKLTKKLQKGIEETIILKTKIIDNKKYYRYYIWIN